MLRLAFDFIITWRETRTRPNAYFLSIISFCSSSVSLSIACFSVSAYSYTEAMEGISVRSSIWEAPKI